MLIQNTKAIFDLARILDVDIGVAKNVFTANSTAFQALPSDVRQADGDAFDALINPKFGKYHALARAYREKDDAAFQTIVDDYANQERKEA